jgi:dihydropyrimidinase
MADYDLLVLNGVVVTDTEIGEKDIAIKDERIVKVAPKGTLSGVTAKRTIDANGGYVMVILRSCNIATVAKR